MLETRTIDADDGPVAAAGRWPVRLALAAALAPFAVAVVVLVAVVGGDYHPWADWAWIEMRTSDVGRHPVELGLWSTDWWFHPGPALFYVLALPYRLTGGASIGILLGAVLVNATAVTGLALVARRLGGRPALFASLGCCGVLLRALGPDFARDPWNPTIVVLPLGLMFFLAWAMTCGHVWALPAAAAVASFVAQTHLGYGFLALPLLAWGALWLTALALRTRHPREHPVTTPVAARALARAAALTALLLAAMWAPPVLEELHHDPGNLTTIWRYFRDSDAPTHTLADGLRVLAAQFALRPEWITGHRPLTITGEPVAIYQGTPVPWQLVPLAGAAVVLARRGPAAARRLLLTLGFAAAVGVVSVARTLGLVRDYRLLWGPLLAMVAGVLVVWAVWLVVAPRLPRLGPLAARVRPAALAGVIALAAVNAVAAARAGAPDHDRPASTPRGSESAGIAALVPAVEAALPPEDGPVVVRNHGSEAWCYMFGVQAGLVRDGVDARVAPNFVQVGPHRHHRRGRVRGEVVLATDQGIHELLADRDLVPIAHWGRVPPSPPPDDAAARIESVPGGPEGMREMQRIARATVARGGDLRRPFEVHAVAAFLRRR